MVADTSNDAPSARLIQQQADTIRQQADTIRQLQQEVADLTQRIADLEEQLRAAQRQAAPFRRRPSQKKPEDQKKRPGRAPGHPGAYRRVPETIDQQLEVPLPGCPYCQGPVTDLTKREQVIEELPPMRPIVVQVTTWTGRCARCGRVESRHPLQTTTATGAAGTHLGPRAQALALVLAHRSGLTMGRTCQTLHELCGLKLTRGGLAQLLQRAAGRLEPLYEALLQQLRASAAVFADETSWYVGGPKWWLWVFTTPEATLYRVEPGRGSDVVRQTLGPAFSGMLVSDCLSSYDPIACRKHKCIAHHLRALKEQDEALRNRGIASLELLLWKVHLQDVIATWQRREELSPEAYAAKVAQLQRGVENLRNRSPPEPEEVAFRNRMTRQREHLLGCLEEPAAEPTNNRADRELRPAVIDRKLSCGNKTEAGKRAWEILRSVMVSLPKQGHDLLEALPPRLALAGE